MPISEDIVDAFTRKLHLLGDSLVIAIENDHSPGALLESDIYRLMLTAKYVDVYRNLIIPNEGRTTELDVVLLSARSIVVFECKDYSGKIYGDELRQQWYQYVGRNRYSFFNPIIQNHVHLKALQRLTNTTLPIVSVVVFGTDAKVGGLEYNETPTLKVCTYKYIPAVFDAIRKDFPTLDSDEAKRVQSILKPFSRATKDEREAHAESVQARLNSDICPYCGKKLVKRRGPKSEFYGCSGYPRCHYTREIK